MNAELLTQEEAAILDHTIHRAAGGFYCGGSNAMENLVSRGLMKSAGFKPFVPDEYFSITRQGRDALAEHKAGSEVAA